MSTGGSIPTALGKYQISGVLGRGAMGIVYDGLDPVIGRRVAIKTVRMLDHDDAEARECLARFRNEAQAAGRLSHPNIVAVYDYGETGAIAFIVMEFVAGGSLKELLDAKQTFAVAETVRIMEQVLAALQFSHDKGVIHRDIKPGNVMMTSDGQVKLADFGIARIESSVMTQAGTMLGTPAYMSPEQLMAQAVDARSDIYSAGVLLYQLLTGERPFEGGLTAIMHKALNTSPPRPSEISVTAPPGLDAVVARAMARRPDERFANAAAFAGAMREATARPAGALDGLGLGLGLGPGSGPGLGADDEATMVAPVAGRGVTPRPIASLPPRAGTREGAKPLLLGGAAVVLVGLIGGGAWLALRPAGVGPAAVGPGSGMAAAPGIPAAPAVPAPVSLASGPSVAVGPAPVSAGPDPSAAVSAAPVAPVPGSSASAQSEPAGKLETAMANPAPAEDHAVPVAPGLPAERVAIAPVNAAALREALAGLTVSARCAMPRFAVSEAGGVAVSGPVGAGGPESGLREAVRSAVPGAAANWDVLVVDGVYCDILDIVRPIAQPGSPFLGLGLKDEATNLRTHDFVLPVVKMPEFPAHLLVDYFSHDGSVTHLYPIRGVAAPAFAPNTVVRLGTSAKDQVEVGPPYGTDLIVATVSSVPLFSPGGVRPDETMQTYLPVMRAAIAAAQRRGSKLTGRALVVKTAER